MDGQDPVIIDVSLVGIRLNDKVRLPLGIEAAFDHMSGIFNNLSCILPLEQGRLDIYVRIILVYLRGIRSHGLKDIQILR